MSTSLPTQYSELNSITLYKLCSAKQNLYMLVIHLEVRFIELTTSCLVCLFLLTSHSEYFAHMVGIQGCKI